MKSKILGSSLILICLIGILKVIQIDSVLLKSSSIKYSKKLKSNRLFLNQVWHDDFKRLINAGEIPRAWTKIKKVTFIATNLETKTLIKYLSPPINLNKNGDYILEISVISHQSEKNKTQIILQHNIIDINNENTVWELNRTYNLIR